MPRIPPCPPSEDLQRFLLGQLGEAEAGELERHLAACRLCVARLGTMQPHDRLVDVVTLVARGGAAPATKVDGVLLGALYQLQERSTGLFGETIETNHPSAPFDNGTSLALHGNIPTFERTEDLAAFLEPAQEPGEIGRFGSYSIVRVLGAGGMGIVFEARQRQPRRVVALKMILVGRHANRERLARFHCETEIIARLKHPNIVPIHEVHEYDGRPFFTMEYVDGGSLASKLKEASLTPRAAAVLVELLARTVHFAHVHGIVHRDLKPSNVLLTATGVPMIVDFGLAKYLDAGRPPEEELTQSGAIIGTPAYMAPEQAAGQGAEASTSADVYALGAILYECVTGRPPFRAATILDTLEQVRTREPLPPNRLLPDLPRDLQTICLKCLAKEPDRRYRSGQDLAADLGRFLRGEPIQARPVSAAEHLRKWVRRKPALAALLAVSVCAVAALLAGGVVYEHRLRAAWTRAEANAIDASRQKERADANYRQARETLGRILQKTRERDTAGLPRLKELERRQSEEALAFYLKLADQTGDDPELRQDSARAQHDAALLQHSLGRDVESKMSLESARARFARLVDEFPDEPNYRLGLADCLLALPSSDVPPQQAAQHTEEGLALIEALVHNQPDSTNYLTALARACNQMAVHRDIQNRRDEAAALYRRAIVVREELLHARPDDRQLLSQIAETCVNFSQLCFQMGDLQNSRELHDRAETQFGRLIQDDPEDFPARTGLATLRLNWAYVLRKEKRAEDAIAGLTKNVRELEVLRRQEPNSVIVRDLLYRTHGLRAELFANQGRYPEALDDQQKSLEYVNAAGRELHRLFVAMAYARAGQHVEAVHEAKALTALMTNKTVLEHRLHLAYVCGVAAKAARADPTLGESERRTCAAEDVALGLEYLREARKTVSAEEWSQLLPEFLVNSDLAPLREDARWQELSKP